MVTNSVVFLTNRWLGLDALEPVPTSCRNIFEVLCKRMEEKLTFGPDEKVLTLLLTLNCGSTKYDDFLAVYRFKALWLSVEMSWTRIMQDMVLLHHELDVAFDGSRERHTATLLAFGETADSCCSGRPESAMARTVGIPAAIAAEVRGNELHSSSPRHSADFLFLS